MTGVGVREEYPVVAAFAIMYPEAIETAGLELFVTPWYQLIRSNGIRLTKVVWSPEMNDVRMLGYVNAGHGFELYSTVALRVGRRNSWE